MACVVLQSNRPFAMKSAQQQDNVSSCLHVDLFKQKKPQLDIVRLYIQD